MLGSTKEFSPRGINLFIPKPKRPWGRRWRILRRGCIFRHPLRVRRSPFGSRRRRGRYAPRGRGGSGGICLYLHVLSFWRFWRCSYSVSFWGLKNFCLIIWPGKTFNRDEITMVKSKVYTFIPKIFGQNNKNTWHFYKKMYNINKIIVAVGKIAVSAKKRAAGWWKAQETAVYPPKVSFWRRAKRFPLRYKRVELGRELPIKVAPRVTPSFK